MTYGRHCSIIKIFVNETDSSIFLLVFKVLKIIILPFSHACHATEWVLSDFLKLKSCTAQLNNYKFVSGFNTVTILS